MISEWNFCSDAFVAHITKNIAKLFRLPSTSISFSLYIFLLCWSIVTHVIYVWWILWQKFHLLLISNPIFPYLHIRFVSATLCSLILFLHCLDLHTASADTLAPENDRICVRVWCMWRRMLCAVRCISRLPFGIAFAQLRCAHNFSFFTKILQTKLNN